MKLIDDVRGKVNDWLFGVALKKGVKAAVTFVVALIASAKVAPILAQYGVSIDPNQLEIGLTATFTTLLTIGINYLKVRVGVKFL